MVGGTGAKLPLLKSQKNDVFRVVELRGFHPADFEWVVMESPLGDRVTIDVLRHKASQFDFLFDINRRRPPLGVQADRISIYRPGLETPVGRSDDFDWDGQLGSLSRWLDFVRRETTQESLWEQLDQEPLRVVATSTYDNERLSKDERRAIEAGVAQAKAYVENVVADTAQLARIEQKLDEICDASTRLGRRDFANAAMGALMGVAFEAVLTSEQMNTLAGFIFTNATRLLGQ